MIEHSFWYASRAAGFAAYILLSLSVGWGLALSTRVFGRSLARPAIYEAHRLTSICVILLMILHALLLVGDSYIDWDAAALLVPFASDYRPLPVAAGIIALNAAVLVTATFYLRGLLGHRSWRLLHHLSFAIYALATVHGLAAGSDTAEPWARATYLTSLGTVVFLVNLRILGGATSRAGRATGRAAGGLSPNGRSRI